MYLANQTFCNHHSLLHTEMQKHMSLLVLVYTIGILASAKSGCGSTCNEIEKQALLLLKESLVDNSAFLSSWAGDNCCAWHGIHCDNLTGHVMQLDLRNGDLRGDHINPSLLDLKFLIYLDLSSNQFNGMQIPEFLDPLGT